MSVLIAAVEAGHSEQLTTYLQTLAKFHNYSFRNVLLIALQHPSATQVAGYQQWRKLERQVRKGEKGIAILAPVMKRQKRADKTGSPPQQENEDPPATPSGYRTTFVFDISQTDGKPLPEFPAVQGDPGDLIATICQALKRSNIAVIFDYVSGGAQGESSGGQVTVRPDLSAAETLRTLVHEFAHELLHKGDRRKETTKKIRETEAEAVAFAVCTAVGLQMNSSSSDYIQLYNGSAKTLMESLEHIRNCSAAILAEIGVPPAK